MFDFLEQYFYLPTFNMFNLDLMRHLQSNSEY